MLMELTETEGLRHTEAALYFVHGSRHRTPWHPRCTSVGMRQTTTSILITSVLLGSPCACRNPMDPVRTEPQPWREQTNAPSAVTQRPHSEVNYPAEQSQITTGGKGLGPGPDLPYLGGASGSGNSKHKRVAYRQ